MRIGIDGYNLAMTAGTGVATYGFTLAHALKAAGHRIEGVFGIDAGRDADLHETLFFDQFGRGRRVRRLELMAAYRPGLQMAAHDVPLTPRVDRQALAERFPPFDRVVTAPALFARAHRHFATFRRFLPLRMANPPEVMHWTYPVPITLAGARNIYTIHDVVPLKLPYTTLTAKPTYRALLARCIADAARICTVSGTSRADLIREFDAAPDHVVNCYQVAPPSPASGEVSANDDAAALDRAFGLVPRGYFLFFGAIEPKKNVGRLIEAHLSRDTATPLVIVGGKGWQSEGELGLVSPDASLGAAHAARLARRVIRLGHLPRTMLVRLIRNARTVAFPSIAEGFGLPVLEAMQLGTPVLTSRGGALEEVAGQAALLVDPFDVSDIARGLEQLDHDAALRTRLMRDGPIRAATFSRAAFLKRLEHLYIDALRDAPPAA